MYNYLHDTTDRKLKRVDHLSSTPFSSLVLISLMNLDSKTFNSSNKSSFGASLI